MLVSGKAGKEVPVAEEVSSSGGANTDEAADGGALASDDGDADEGGNEQKEGLMEEPDVHNGKCGYCNDNEADVEAKAAESDTKTELQGNA